MQLIVIKDSDDIAIGKIEAYAGMKLTNGYEIIKVNSKSVIAIDGEDHKETFFSPVSIYYTEAKRWGFNNLEVNDSAEDFAAAERKFRWGVLHIRSISNTVTSCH